MTRNPSRKNSWDQGISPVHCWSSCEWLIIIGQSMWSRSALDFKNMASWCMCYQCLGEDSAWIARNYCGVWRWWSEGMYVNRSNLKMMEKIKLEPHCKLPQLCLSLWRRLSSFRCKSTVWFGKSSRERSWPIEHLAAKSLNLTRIGSAALKLEISYNQRIEVLSSRRS